MRKTLIYMLASVVLCLAALPVITQADDYNIKVNGVSVNAGNKDDILGDSGSAVFDTESVTLTLNGYTGGAIESEGSLTVLLTENTDNVITVSGSHGLSIENGTLLISGSGNLSVDVTEGNYDGIRVLKDIEVSGSGIITVNTVNGNAIFTQEGDLFVNGTGELYASSLLGYAALFGTTGKKLLINGTTAPISFSSIGKYAVYNTPDNDNLPVGGSSLLLYTNNTIFEDKKTVIYDKYDIYDLWLGSTGVTELNKDDILNDGGTAKYDPEKHTLTLEKVPAITDAVTEIIDTGLEELIIEVPDGLCLNGTSDYGITSSGNIIINGDFSSEGLKYPVHAVGNITINGDVDGTAENCMLCSVEGNVNVTGSVTATAGVNVILAGGSASIDGEASLTLAGTGEIIKAKDAIMLSDDVIITALNEAPYGILSTEGAILINADVTFDAAALETGIYGKSLIMAGNINGILGSNLIEIFDGDAMILGNIDVVLENAVSPVRITKGKLTKEGNLKIVNNGENEFGTVVTAKGDITWNGDIELDINAKAGLVSTEGTVTLIKGKWIISVKEAALLAGNGISIPETYMISVPEYGETSSLNFSFEESPGTFFSVVGDNTDVPAAIVVIEECPPEYAITEGEGSTYAIGSGKTLSFLCNAELFGLNSVWIDGVETDAGNYERKNALRTLVLTQEYLETLSEGEHSIKIVFEDGETETVTFSVIPYVEESSSEEAESSTGESESSTAESTEESTEETTEEPTESSEEETESRTEEPTEKTTEEMTEETVSESESEETEAGTEKESESGRTGRTTYRVSWRPFALGAVAGLVAVWITLAIAFIIRRKNR